MKLNEKEYLERLMLSENLEELNGLTGDFNIFNALKLQNNENRHSNFLGWLLRPYESHNLGDYFLKEILKISLKNHSQNEEVKASLEDVIFNSFEDSEIVLEKQTDKNRRIDIFIDSPTNQFLCLIENKIWSGEGFNQLEDYEEYINNHEKYKNYKHKVFLFLTPNADYNQKALYKNYIRIDYSQIYNVIIKILKFKEKSMSEEVKIFIEHYKKMIERNIMKKTDEKIVTLCRKIYREHKEAIDLINENTDVSADIANILKEFANEQSTELYTDQFPKYIRFLPINIKNVDKLRYGKFNKWAGGNILALEFEKNNDKFNFTISIQPAEFDYDEERQKLIESLKQKLLQKYPDINFHANKNGWFWVNKEIISIDEYNKFEDINEFKKEIEKRIKETGYIDIFRDVINNLTPVATS